MPAKSAAQQKAAGAALSAKRGDTPKSKLKGASKQMVESMTEKQLEEFATPNARASPSTSTTERGQPVAAGQSPIRSAVILIFDS